MIPKLVCIGRGENTTQYCLVWERPSNIDNFDPDHYEVTIIGQSANETITTVNNYIVVAINNTILSSELNVSIVTITKCGQRGSANDISLQLGKCSSETCTTTMNPSSSHTVHAVVQLHGQCALLAVMIVALFN